MRSIAIQIFDEKNRSIAESCKQNLQLPFLSEQIDAKLLLCYHEDRWFLRQNTSHDLALGDLYLDFLSGAVNHRFMQGGGKGQDIAKAVGLGKKNNLGRPLHVLDATAGLGRDAFVLASLGCRVDMCEENAVVQFLLEQAISSGLQQLEDSISQGDESGAPLYSTLQRMHCSFENSVQRLENKQDSWDVVYLDPMFPERNKSAKVKKEMQYLQLLLHSETDSLSDVTADKDQAETALLEAALQSNCSRVVVKRPAHAPCLSSQTKPSHAIKGKSTRFDVYALKALRD